MSYCRFANSLPAGSSDPNKHYHDHVYGFAVADDKELFERLVLEINQAGLSLLADTGIVRNRLKINAAIHNARQILAIQAEHGSFKNWLDAHAAAAPGLDSWLKIFKKTFRFVGREIVNEFLMSTGYLPGAHDADCPVAARLGGR